MALDPSQTEHSDDFELQLVSSVRHPLRQSVQMQIEIADPDHGSDQKNADEDHHDIGIARRRYESWQMMGGAWMK